MHIYSLYRVLLGWLVICLLMVLMTTAGVRGQGSTSTTTRTAVQADGVVPPPGTVYDCPSGLWGENCTGECHCLNGDSQCDPTTGICLDYQCDRGWTDPPWCQTECLPLKWGANCAFKCNCPEGETCSRINGLCSSGRCHVEWSGPGCQIRHPRLTQQPRITNVTCSDFYLEWNVWSAADDIGTPPVGSYWIQQSTNFSSWTDVTLVDSVPDEIVLSYYFTHINPYSYYEFRVVANRLDDNSKTKRGLPGPSSQTMRPYSHCVVPTTAPPTTTTTTIATTEMQTTTTTAVPTTTTTTITTFKPTTTTTTLTTVTTTLPETTTIPRTTTTAPNPPGPVQNIRVTVDPSGYVEITWATPLNVTHDIYSYNLSYQIVGIGDCNATYREQEVNVSTPREIRRYVIPNLVPWRRYRLLVIAENIAGGGSISETFFQSHEIAPTGSVSGVTTSDLSPTSAVLVWGPVDCAARGGILYRYAVSMTDTEAESVVLNTVTTARTLTLSDLVPYRRYSTRVVYENRIGTGPQSEKYTFTSEQDVPPAPRSFKIVNYTDESVYLSWLTPYPPHGILREYRVIYWAQPDPDVQFNVLQSASEDGGRNMTNLKPYTLYMFMMEARTDATSHGGWGNRTDIISQRTADGFPSVPRDFRRAFRNTTCMGLSWEAPKDANGIINAYKLSFTVLASRQSSVDPPTEEQTVQLGGDVRSHMICDLLSATHYSLVLAARTAKGHGPSASVDAWTEMGVPDIPPRPVVRDITETTVTLRLQPVVLRSGPVSGYFLVVNIIEDEINARRRKRALPDPVSSIPLPGRTAAELSRNDVTRARDFVIGDGVKYGDYINSPLLTGKLYTFYYVVASSLDGVTKMSFSQISTPVVVGTTTTTTTTSTKSTTKSGQTPPRTPVSTPSTTTTTTTTTTRKPITTTSVTTSASTSTEAPTAAEVLEGANSTLLIVAIVVPLAVIIIALIIILLFCCLRKKKKYLMDEDEKDGSWLNYYTNNYYNTLPKSKKLTWSDIHDIDAPRYVTEKEGSPYSPDDLKVAAICNSDPPNISFAEEYKHLPQGTTFVCKAAKRPQNQEKNRFDHILAYDHSRVVLKGAEGSGDDYINANYVHGYDKTRNAYIAAQSPFNEETICDFWYMVYQENVSQIVFCSRLMEDGIMKSEQYWPTSGDSQYADVTVQHVKSETFANFVIRTFDLTCNGESKRTRQYQFTSWPDHGVPDDPIPFLEFRLKVITDVPASEGPVLVHCGTGVSRSAVFIAVDQLLEQAKQENVVNVFKYCSQMRHNRPIMVRTLKQYIFIYDSLLEALITNYNVVGDDLKINYRLLSNVNPVTDKSYFKEQYEVLEMYTPKLNSEQCLAGNLEQNIKKNRFPSILPPDKYRPVLKTPGGLGRTDYINAIFQDTYKLPKGLILTQTPLQNTVTDFWKLVYDFNVNTVVMMNSAEFKEETCSRYWPIRIGQHNWDPFFVNLMFVEEEDHVTIRTMKLTNAQKPSAPAREVRQFQFESWRMYEKLPWSRDGLLQLIEMVDEWREETEQRKSPIIVHCCDGGTHSGLFATSYVVCEKFRVEGEVDIFHTVKHMKQRRLQIVNSLDQYKFVFKMLWDYINTRMKTRKRPRRTESRSNGHVPQRVTINSPRESSFI